MHGADQKTLVGLNCRVRGIHKSSGVPTHRSSRLKNRLGLHGRATTQENMDVKSPHGKGMC